MREAKHLAGKAGADMRSAGHAGPSDAPLGPRDEDDLRLSIAGAQEKTALLRVGRRWHRPLGRRPAPGSRGLPQEDSCQALGVAPDHSSRSGCSPPPTGTRRTSRSSIGAAAASPLTPLYDVCRHATLFLNAAIDGSDDGEPAGGEETRPRPGR